MKHILLAFHYGKSYCQPVNGYQSPANGYQQEISLTHKGPAKRIQHHPTLLNPTLLDDVAQCSTRWPNERNMLASEADYFGLDVIKIYLQFVFDLFISPLSLFPDMILLTKYVPQTWSFFQ